MNYTQEEIRIAHALSNYQIIFDESTIKTMNSTLEEALEFITKYINVFNNKNAGGVRKALTTACFNDPSLRSLLVPVASTVVIKTLFTFTKIVGQSVIAENTEY